ncbi:MAG TPA: glycerophosphodiester phosphodiesterase family protein [Gemmatales bacterium]|nr:glycerophosphodiester phosphodiesterase family protein [Gemmatales bacterium]
MTQPFKPLALMKPVWNDFCLSRRPLILFTFALKFAELLLILPLVTLGLSLILSLAGHIAVSNQEIISFFLSPLGLLYAGIVSVVSASLLMIEQAGYISFVALADSVKKPTLKQYLSAAVTKPTRVIELAVVKLLLMTLAGAPFALLGYLVYRLLLSEHDINFYLAERPPAFWIASCCGGVLLAGALVVGVFLYVRWSLALPILLFENKYSFTALRTSRERVRGASWRFGVILFGWLIGALLFGVVLEVGYQHFAAYMLSNVGERATLRLLGLLIGQAGLLAMWSFIVVVGVGLITWRLYRMRSEELGLIQRTEVASDVTNEPKAINWKLLGVSMVLMALSPIAIWFSLSRFSAERKPCEVTAHRGHARAAPENTISAVRKAIESGAEYAEIDVLQTSDGVVVLLHDRDFKRVSGDPRRISEMTFDNVRKLDVGSWFSPAFAGERVPTLEEVMKLARGKIRLNIEMKFFDNDLSLARNVERLIRENDFEKECIVTSFNLEALMEIKRLNPRIRVGLIVAQALGNIGKLDVDLFSIRADWLSDKTLRDIKRRGKEVHVWTVNDPLESARLIKRGVDNILTSDPDMVIGVRNEWANLTSAERFMQSSRLLLGLEP